LIINYTGGIKMTNNKFQEFVESRSKKKGLTVLVVLLITCLGSIILLGCSNNGSVVNNKNNNITAVDKEVPAPKPSQEPGKLAPNIISTYAEAKPNVELEKAIIDYLEIPEEYLAKTKYYYNYVDLNMDGNNEIFVVVMGPYTSGTGGSTALHITQANTGMKVNQKFTMIQTPVIVSDKVTNGGKELIVRKSGGGATSSYVVLTCSDGKYTTVNEGTAIPGLEAVFGKAIISNDILKDMEEGKALYLQKR
jgi:hypothetical protein